MALTFYPHAEDVQMGILEDRLEIFMKSAEDYKAAVLELAQQEGANLVERRVPRELLYAYNWGDLATLVKELRNLPEISPNEKTRKGNLLNKLAETYEVLRGAKMPKLEAVRLALINEVNQLRG